MIIESNICAPVVVFFFLNLLDSLRQREQNARLDSHFYLFSSTYLIKHEHAFKILYIFTLRERCNNKPILTVTSDGSIEAGSVSSVIGAVKLGQDIQATIGFGYAVSVDNIEYNDLEDEFTAMDVWRITKTPTLAARIYVFTVSII